MAILEPPGVHKPKALTRIATCEAPVVNAPPASEPNRHGI
jgi:hypothetical protein